MSDIELSPVEQKYFDTRGAESFVEPPAPVTVEPVVPPPPAEGIAKAADEPADNPELVEDKDNPGKFVRHGAFHEERMRRKETEENFNRFREQTAAERARLEERLNALTQRFQQPEPQLSADPVERLARVEQTLNQRLQQEEQQNRAQQEQNALFNVVAQHEREFAKDAPDYYEAVEYAKQIRLEEFKAMGFDDQEAEQILLNDVLNLTKDALGRRINPAERFYKYAKARGWGKQTETAPVIPQAVEPGAKIKTITAGQQAAKSLSTAPGTSQPALTLQALADMPQDEFDKIDNKTWKKMMGG